jgi:RHH-type proline utilization regulon transcriptional repressor/proline dehydrogenase/delta 1-pyrroline-5-carboxylate dehydrogenase
MGFFVALLAAEGGRTVPNAISEVREAVDFCRYYALNAEQLMSTPRVLPGPTGEHNQLSLTAKGVFACVSPWNFPLAIFMGQVVAALVTGNAVLAKPADQTPMVAFYAIELLHACGVPVEILHFLPAKGSLIGEHLIADPRISGVIFTGSTQTAQVINQTLSARLAPIATLIAETGGINSMLVDSSALAEQVVSDVVRSAFDSAGQRCSALRLLYLQEDIADKVIEMLIGAMELLTLGDPLDLATDIGPVIDARSQTMLEAYVAQMRQTAGSEVLYQVPVPDALQNQGHFFGPCLIALSHSELLKEEIFGPVLHVVRFKRGDLAAVIEGINKTGYGLTLGIHSRIQETIDTVLKNVHVGNCYVNRNMVGAVVGVQPFGGEGWSGTGPKAGGPHYLLRLCTERTVSIDTTAAGGNASLLCMGEN